MDNDCNEGCGDGEEVGDDNDEGDERTVIMFNIIITTLCMA